MRGMLARCYQPTAHAPALSAGPTTQEKPPRVAPTDPPRPTRTDRPSLSAIRRRVVRAAPRRELPRDELLVHAAARNQLVVGPLHSRACGRESRAVRRAARRLLEEGAREGK
eukprot:1787381-Prymnesium_polylepis.2